MAEEKQHHGFRSLKERWRSKTIPDPPITPTNQDQNVADFLRPSTLQAQANALRQIKQRSLALSAPKIDIAAAQRWAGSNANGNGGTTPSSLKRGGSVKKPRRPNLAVTFSDMDYIIGIGGEECEDPSMAIAELKSRRKPDSPSSGLESVHAASLGSSDESDCVRARSDVKSPSARLHHDVSENEDKDNRPVVFPQARFDRATDIAYRRLVGDDVHDLPATVKLIESDNQHDQYDKQDQGMRKVEPKFLRRSATGFRNRSSMSSTCSDTGSPDLSPQALSHPIHFPARPAAPQMSTTTLNLPDFDSLLASPLLNLSFDALVRHDSNELPRSPIELQNKISRMRREEGRVLHQNSRRSFVELAKDDDVVVTPESHDVQDKEALSKPQPNIQSVTTPSIAEFRSNTFISHQYSPSSPEQTRHPLQALSEWPRTSPIHPNAWSTTPGLEMGSEVKAEAKSKAKTQARTEVKTAAEAAVEATVETKVDAESEAKLKAEPQPRSVIIHVDSHSPLSSDKNTPAAPPLASPISFPEMQPLQRKAVPKTSSTLAPTAPPKPAQLRITPSPLVIPGKDYFTTKQSPLDAIVSMSSRTPSSQTPTTAVSVKTFTSTMAQVAYADFGSRCSNMWAIFRLQAEFECPISKHPPSQWLRAAAWWFIKGRTGLEQLIRARSKSADAAASQELLNQPHVDLAKCWWIVAEILPNHEALAAVPSPDLSYTERAAAAAASVNNAHLTDLFDSCQIVVQSLRAVILSMNKNNMMPPSSALVQGQDQTIWTSYPQFPANIRSILSGTLSTSSIDRAEIRQFDSLAIMAVADTKNDFAYNSSYAKVSLKKPETVEEPIAMLCLFSVMRIRNDWHPKVAICSQKELVTICITGDHAWGPSWEDVKWSESDASLQVMLAHGYVLNAQLARHDYESLVGVYQNAYTVQTSLFPLDDLHVVYETQLADFQYSDTLRPPVFPLERMRRCRVRLMFRIDTRKVGPMTRRFYKGIRVLVTTSPKNRTLASVSHDLDVQLPLIVENVTEKSPTGDSLPALTLFIKEPHRDISLFMVFSQLKYRQQFCNAANQMNTSSREIQSATVRLKKMSIEPAIDFELKGAQNPLGRMQWEELRVICSNTESSPSSPSSPKPPASDSHRIISTGTGGTVTDRLNIIPGQLRLRVAEDGTNSIIILRQPQDDLSMTFDRRVAPFTSEQIEQLHQAIFKIPTRRTFAFYNAADLHAFQESTTAFKVSFDTLARSIAISRRRPVVTALSKNKRLEAGLTRIQIVSSKDDDVSIGVQLLAFFASDFVYADALAFVLKPTDVVERYNDGKPGARFGVRLADAKFTLPKMQKSTKQNPVDRSFVCLSLPDVPTENDDVFIGFDDEQERERFLQALPCPIPASICSFTSSSITTNVAISLANKGMASRLGIR